MTAPLFLMTDASAFEVAYRINPWMKPTAWRADDLGHRAAALAASAALRRAIEAAGARVETIGAVRGLPDLVFPANAATVLDGKVLLARFRHPERQGEEAVLREVFARLLKRGLVREVVELPDHLFHEGAGDAIWDADRGLIWAGWGPRSSRCAASVVARTFGQEVVPVELATDRYYHLDTCFCPLEGGALLYYPPAFTPASLEAIRARVAPDQRIEASDEEAQAFCVNAINLGRRVVMAKAPASLKATLATHGFDVTEVDLAPFILSGGAAYCMTLRLDRTTETAAQRYAAE
jgi:N-dimethylarginine dimethylaminohydrolase